MKCLFKTAVLALLSVVILNSYPAAVLAENVREEVENKATIQKFRLENVSEVNPLELVENPDMFMDKEVKMTAQFHKFSTLGLDYERVMRSSKDYISILIKRPDVSEKYVIPLSELKLIIKREQAEDLLDMESGDKVEITGKVFSSALKDPWVDVYELTSLEPKTVDGKKTDKKAKK